MGGRGEFQKRKNFRRNPSSVVSAYSRKGEKFGGRSRIFILLGFAVLMVVLSCTWFFGSGRNSLLMTDLSSLERKTMAHFHFPVRSMKDEMAPNPLLGVQFRSLESSEMVTTIGRESEDVFQLETTSTSTAVQKNTPNWVRPALVPDDLHEAVYMKLSPKAVPEIAKFVRDVVRSSDKILATEQDYRDAAKITKGLNLYVAPVSDYTMYCLGRGDECDGTLGCWDKRLWLFAREAFSKVNPKEADFVLMPYFQFCFFYKEGCYARIGKRKATTMDTLNLIYNETINHLEEVAPGRNWSYRIVVPLSHDFGGCVRFGLTQKDKERRIIGQPPVLLNSIVVGAMGDYDEPCYIRGKDVVFPAYIEHSTIDEEVVQNSQRKFLIYFGGTLQFDLRKPGIRHTLANPDIYQHMERHVIGYVKPRSNYSSVIHNTAFCLGPPGVVGWTGRVWEALWAGCIPVFISEYTAHPWEEFVDYRKFSLHYNYSDTPNIEKLLMDITPQRRDSLQKEGQKLRDLFVFKPPYTQEKGPMSYLFKTLRRRKALMDSGRW